MRSLKEAVKFHGHLGPYLVLGILAGNYGIKKLKAKKYFGITVKVWGATVKPKSCLIDGLQLSTGATYGKGNIEKAKGKKLKILLRNLKNRKSLLITLKEDLVCRLSNLKGHRDAQVLAEELYAKFLPSQLFYLTANK
jgi:formylmethanofuran dehydrogenase subunit E